jgi:hypothetical protein
VNLRPENIYKNESINFIAITNLFEKQKSGYHISKGYGVILEGSEDKTGRR